MLITFPVIKAYSSVNYALMLLDSAGVTHYFNSDGSYDGHSSDCGTDCATGINEN